MSTSMLSVGISVCCDFRPSPDNPIRALDIRSVTGPGGGADQIVLRTAAHGKAFGLSATVCAIYQSWDRAFDLPERGEQLGVNVIGVPQRWPLDPQVYQRLRAITAATQVDVIHSHDYKANYYARRLGRELQRPIVSTAHGWTGNLVRERRLYYPIDKRLLRRFDAVIGVSHDISQELRRHHVPRTRVYTILNGVEPEKYRRCPITRQRVREELGVGPQDLVIGSVGRVEKQKRFDLLVEAFARVAELRHGRSMRLIVAGTGSLLDDLRALVRKRRLDDKCQFVGHYAHMERLYQAFDMYVQSSEYEGTPTVLVEAMAMEIPIVATDVGGTTELVRAEEHAFIVPSDDPAALAQGMMTTLEDPLATRQRVARARQRVEQELSLDHRTTKLLQVYRKLVRA